MKRLIPALCGLALALAPAASFAQASVNTNVDARTGASVKTPGHKMQTKGSVKGTTGASGYAPGQKMQTRGSVKGTTGASGYAPGHIKSDTDIKVKTR